MRRRKRRSSWHHRKCRSNGGTDEVRNLSRVNMYDHQAWHRLFRNWEAERISEVINEIWLDPDWELVARRRR